MLEAHGARRDASQVARTGEEVPDPFEVGRYDLRGQQRVSRHVRSVLGFACTMFVYVEVGPRQRCVKGLYNVVHVVDVPVQPRSPRRVSSPSGHRWDAAIVWFRRDLRVADHPALQAAVAGARAVIPLFVLDPRLFESGSTAPARRWFLAGSLAELDRSLRSRGSGLVVRMGAPEEVVPELARATGASVVLASRDVTPFSHERDSAVAAALARDGHRLLLQPGLLLAEPEAMLTSAGMPYSVYTPFWRILQQRSRRTELAAPARIDTPPDTLDGPPLPRCSVGWPRRCRHPTRPAASRRGGRASAPPRLGRRRPARLRRSSVIGWTASRPRTWVPTCTSARSHPYRSSRRPSRSVSRRRHSCGSSPGASSITTCSSIAAPRLIRWLASRFRTVFRVEADDPEAVSAWRAGRTGIPSVDAAMRQLLATSWLSNRARLIVASFLTRHLLMDYRIGERHFLRHLIDGDVANNRGGWQWTAGVGVDPQPWFRIFNPVLQGRRFDPDGAWVRRWVPELTGPPRSPHPCALGHAGGRRGRGRCAPR